MKHFMLGVLLTAAAVCAWSWEKTGDDPVRKLGVFLGKWQSEATFANGSKATSQIDCRWSPQNRYLVCEQLVKTPTGQQHQLTIYSYNYINGTYSYSTFPDTGMAPKGGTLEINGNVWTYSSSFDSAGKTTQVKVTNDFSVPGTETFKTELSDDGGANWKTILQGAAHKTGE